MKKSSILFLVALVFSACTTQSPEGFEIKGKLTGLPTGQAGANLQTIYLEELTATAVTVKDSIKIEKDGEFIFTGQILEVGFYRLRIAQNNFINIILDKQDKIQITADANNLYYTYKVEGSENNQLLYQLNNYMQSINVKVDSLRRVFQTLQSNMAAGQAGPNIDSVNKAIGEEYNNTMLSKINFIRSFIDNNFNSFVALAAIEQLDPTVDLAYYIKVDKALFASNPNSQYVKNFHTKVSQLSKLAAGSDAPEIVLNDPGDVPIALSSFRGKVVLIDFWASWCKPCRIENPNVVRLYNKYREKGFEIYGVSLDKNKTAWVKAINDDGLEWVHVSDLGFWNSAVVKLYDIKSIPQTYLIDENGIIIAKGLRGAALESKLEEIM